MRQPSLSLPRPPVTSAQPVIAFGPFYLDRPLRPVPMEVKVTVPAEGDDLPVLLFSHGHGASHYLSSVRGYAPLVEFWAAHGFAVLQVTHLDSATLALDTSGREGATFWRSRATDISVLIDRLDQVEPMVPGLAGRLDRNRIAVAGHSLGGQTVTLLSGARMTDPRSGQVFDLTEPRLGAAIAIAPPGNGTDLAGWARHHYPELGGVDLSTMRQPVLTLVGDKDFSANFSNRESWRSDPFHVAPSPQTLATIFAGEHLLGGISGWDSREASDENPSRLAEVQRLTWAYLRTALDLDGDVWSVVARDFEGRGIGRIQSK